MFQLESGGIRDLLLRMKPDCFSDIIATAALYRPGPLEGGMVDDYVAVKHKRKAANYIHPILKEILEETNGVMVYQEQVMRILNRIGGIELAKAYTCIKAISKKKEEIIAANEEKFLSGAVSQGLTKQEAKEFWEMILKFAGYGFNKSHSTAYALIAYQTAYLKTHYKVEFMAALLTGDIDGRNFKRKDSLVEHLEDCQRMGIEVLPPSVQTSTPEFGCVEGKIRFGLTAIKGCGYAAAEAIVIEREKNGPFRDIFDFCERLDPASCNKSTIETLIKSGAMDCFGAYRSQLLAVMEKAIQSGVAKHRDRKSGQKSLFGDEMDDSPAAQGPLILLPNIGELNEREKLAAEKEVLGYYLTAHPLAEFQTSLQAFCSHVTSQLKDCKDREEVMVGGMISSIKLAITKNPKPGQPNKYANFDLEDVDGSVRCILWPDGYATSGHLVVADAVVLLRAVVDRRGGGDEVNLIVNEVIPIGEADTRFTSGLRILMDAQQHDEDSFQRLRDILRGYPGSREVMVALRWPMEKLSRFEAVDIE